MVNQTVEVFGGLDILVTKHGRLLTGTRSSARGSC